MFGNVVISGTQNVHEKESLFRNSLADTAKYDKRRGERKAAYELITKFTDPSHECFVGLLIKSQDKEIRFDAASVIDAEKFDWALSRAVSDDASIEVQLMAMERVNFTNFPSVAVKVAVSKRSLEVRSRILELLDARVFDMVLDNLDVSVETDRGFLKKVYSCMDLKRQKHIRYISSIISGKDVSVQAVRDILDTIEFNDLSRFLYYSAVRHPNSQIRRTVIEKLPASEIVVLKGLCYDSDLFVALDAVEKIDINSDCLSVLATVRLDARKKPHEAVCIKAAKRLEDDGRLTKDNVLAMAQKSAYSAQKRYSIHLLDPCRFGQRCILWELILDDRNSHVMRFEALMRFKETHQKIRPHEYRYAKNIKDIGLRFSKNDFKRYEILQDIRILVGELIYGKK